ncbi:MAG: FHA domain-containing protein [Deltaproteobacteria bacterium]|nr:FHA domain-containing protein [Deltaproteobacteria bacterium]
MDDNAGNPKKSSLRKKVVDLKAVAALLEDSDGSKLPDATAKGREDLPKRGPFGTPSQSRSTGPAGPPAPRHGAAPGLPTAPGLPVFQPNEELIQATARIKSQRDLIKKRCQKMEQSRDKVSKSVFDKVYRDYAMQLDTINKLFNEKKEQLNRELKNFYTLREKQDLDVSRHREILEEARFRHFLDEYSEEQYKEVEEYETREIQHLQSELAQIQSYIKVHEELFDPEDLGFSSHAAVPQQEMRRPSSPLWTSRQTPQAAQTPQAPQSTVMRPTGATTAPFAPSPVPVKPIEEWAEKTPLPVGSSPPARNVVPDKEVLAPEARILPSTEPHEDFDLVMPPEEEGYFTGEGGIPPPTSGTSPGGISSGRISQPAAPGLPEQASFATQPETRPSPYKPQSTQEIAPKKFSGGPQPSSPSAPESIFDILEGIPVESEVSATEPKGRLSGETRESAPRTGGGPAPEVVAATPFPETQGPSSAASQYKLVLIEGDAEPSEFQMKDNVSIGRSPSNDLVLKAARVSRQHAAINKYKDQYIIIDLKSSNGVYVNGRKCDEHTLQDGDQISIGGYKFAFQKI